MAYNLSQNVLHIIQKTLSKNSCNWVILFIYLSTSILWNVQKFLLKLLDPEDKGTMILSDVHNCNSNM